MENKYINEEMCKECGGRCCKKGGCQYAPTDFENLKFNYLLEKLNEGYISIVAALDVNNINGRSYVTPYLYVKSRNVGRPVVDLYSLRTRCSALSDTGCMYDSEHRPSGGLNLIPAKDEKGRCCYPEKDPMEFIQMWQPHQNVLRKLIKQLTGKSAEAKLKEDIYNVFLDIFYYRFEGVSKEELREVLNDTLMLQMNFQQEYVNAVTTYIKQTGQMPPGVRSR